MRQTASLTNRLATTSELNQRTKALNDKVVIFDRIRENLRKYKRMPLVQLLDTLGRPTDGLAAIRVPDPPFLTQIANAGSLALGPDGAVYFAPLAADEIRKYDATGTLRWTATRGLGPAAPRYAARTTLMELQPGGRLKLGKSTGVTTSLTAMYFVVNQRADDSTSDMGGGQLTLSAAAGTRWRVTGAAGYYDYRIRSLYLAEPAGDIRGNRLAPGGRTYLSDFDLLDALVTVDYTGFGERLPLRAVGDLVRNLGADGSNTAWAADLYLGRTQRPGDARLRYGYAQVETDAVLAAFAHDNTTLGTNSQTHTVSVDAVPHAGTLLTATWYLYRPNETPAGVAREYQHRVRLNAMVMF